MKLLLKNAGLASMMWPPNLGVAKYSVYRWIEQRALPSHRVGRLFRFKLSEIDEWVNSGGAGYKKPDSRENH